MGKRRLEKAIREFHSQPENRQFGFKIEWLPFFLDPSLTDEGVSKIERYTRKFGPERVRMMLPQMQKVGLEDGIHFSYGGLIGNTMNSHRLITWCGEKFGFDKQNELVEELFKNYFEQEKNIADLRVLQAAADKCVLPGADEILQNPDAYRANVHELIQKWQVNRGIHGVPHFFVEKYQYGGAQPPEMFLDTFNEIADQFKRAQQRSKT